MRYARILWVIAAVFVIACFFSGAWLGKTLSSMPPVITASPGTAEHADQEILQREQRETAIVTAVASPVAVLVIFLIVLVVSGMITRSPGAATPRTSSTADRRETG